MTLQCPQVLNRIGYVKKLIGWPPQYGDKVMSPAPCGRSACAAAIPAFAAKPLTIGFSQVGAESEWRTANTARSRTPPRRPASP
jgi:hypothetical protein